MVWYFTVFMKYILWYNVRYSYEIYNTIILKQHGLRLFLTVCMFAPVYTVPTSIPGTVPIFDAN